LSGLSDQVGRGAVAVGIDGYGEIDMDQTIDLFEESACDIMWEGLEISPLPLKSIHGTFSEGPMDAYIGGMGSPDVSLSIEVFHILELPARQEVVFDIMERPFDLAMSFLCARFQDHDSEAIPICKCLKSRVDPDL